MKISPPRSAQLFGDPEPHSSIPASGVYLAHIDGASRGNPGPAAFAVVIRDAEGKTVLELAKRIGRETNNVAEYYALLAALDFATSRHIQALRIRSDSELLVRQMQGRYKVKSPDLKPMYERAIRMSKQIPYFTIEHVRREQNSDADGLANVALDSGDLSRAELKPAAPMQPKDAAPAAPPEEAPRAETRKHHAAPDATPAVDDSVSRLRFRAHVMNGTLVPVDPLDLPDGTPVDVDLRVREEE
ncbi:MAG: ribonuclease HI family protein [Chthoniobacterales bacterium]